MSDLDDLVVGVAVGAAVEAEPAGIRAVQAEHVAFAPRSLRMLPTDGEEPGGQQRLQPRRHQVRRHPPIHHRSRQETIDNAANESIKMLETGECVAGRGEEGDEEMETDITLRGRIWTGWG